MSPDVFIPIAIHSPFTPMAGLWTANKTHTECHLSTAYTTKILTISEYSGQAKVQHEMGRIPQSMQ